ncbi:AAA family ATPase [Candidatus Micrarchaeota archaeon]|nr:AAA family ATPase [Candidatus Micrarchaeota archaeon]
MVDRIKSGVPGFDKLVEGGLPRRSSILVSGTSGTGKSTFCSQFAINGAKNGENALVIQLEQERDEVLLDWENFGWDVDKYIKSEKLAILKPQFHSVESMLTQIEDVVRSLKVKRVVLDSSSVLGFYSHDKMQVRQNMLSVFRALKQLGCTSLVVTESEEGTHHISTYGVEEYLADGVVVLYYIPQENQFFRAISVRKMRRTSHSQKLHPVRIESDGIHVYPDQPVFAKVR